MEIKTKVSEACLFLTRLGVQGAEIARFALVKELTKGTHQILVPTEQSFVDIDRVYVLPLKESKFKVVNVEVESREESFQEGIDRHDRGRALYRDIVQCGRLRAELRLALTRVQKLKECLQRVSQASCLDHCRQHTDGYLSVLRALQSLGNEAYTKMEAERFVCCQDLAKVTVQIRSLISQLQSVIGEHRLGPYVNALFHRITNDSETILAQYEAILLGTALRGGQLFFKDHNARVSRAYIILTVELSDTPQSPSTFLIKYPVQGAGWTPSYEVRIDTRDWGRLHVSYYADAHQASLEDWVDADLTFSTGRITEPCNPPNFGVCVVRPTQPSMGGQFLQCDLSCPVYDDVLDEVVCERQDMSIDESFDTDAVIAPRLTADPIDSLNVSMAAFKLSDKVSLASDQANTTQFLMGEFTLPMKSVLYCCPEVETGIYRVCRLENESPYYLVPSKACSVLIDGSLSATTAMKSVAPHEKFTLFVGDAEETKMEVGPAKTWTKSGMGLVKQNDKGYYERSVTVTNHGDITCTILLVFNVVESQDSLVKITLDPSKIPSTTVIEAADDIALLDSSQFPALSTTQVDLKWIENPVTHNCIAVLSLPSQIESVVTFATIMEIPNGRNVQIQALE